MLRRKLPRRPFVRPRLTQSSNDRNRGKAKARLIDWSVLEKWQQHFVDLACATQRYWPSKRLSKLTIIGLRCRLLLAKLQIGLHARADDRPHAAGLEHSSGSLVTASPSSAALGLMVVVEGVEPRHLARALEASCDAAQDSTSPPAPLPRCRVPSPAGSSASRTHPSPQIRRVASTP